MDQNSRSSLLCLISKIIGQLLLTKTKIAMFIAIWLGVVIYFSYNILYEANWVLGDNHQHWAHTAIGNPFYFFGVMPEGMRFAPLVFMDFNILLFFLETPGPFAHYIWVMVSFIIFALSYLYLFLLIAKNNLFSYALALSLCFSIVVFFTKEFALIYMDVIYPERLTILLLSLFLVCYFKAWQVDSFILYLCAIVFASIATYTKEPIFGVFLVLALYNILFHYKKITKKHRLFSVILVLNAVLYLILFYFYVYSVSASGNYAEGRYLEGYWGAIKENFYGNKVLLLACILAFVRIVFLFLRKRQEVHVFFDAILFAGLANAFAFVILNLVNPYYIIPSVVLILPTFLYWILKSYHIFKLLPAVGCAMIILLSISGIRTELQTIQDFHMRRETHMLYTNNLLELLEEGYKFIYVEQPIVDPQNKFNGNVLRTWHRQILEWAFDFILGNERGSKQYFNFTNRLEEKDIDSNTIVFYPTQNDLEQPMDPVTDKNLYSFFQAPQEVSYSIQVYTPFSVTLGRGKLQNVQEVPVPSKINMLNLEKYFLSSGWDKPEEWGGRWTNAKKANLSFKVSPKINGVRLHANVAIPKDGYLEVIILVNGFERIRNKVTGFSVIDIPFTKQLKEKIEEIGEVNLEIMMPNAQSPHSMGDSVDMRVLGLAVSVLETY